MTTNNVDLVWCQNHIRTKVFKLRPAAYEQEHPIWPGMVGIELEMMPFDVASLDTPKPKLIPLHGEHSLNSYLKKLCEVNRLWKPNFSSDGSLISVDLGEQDQLTFEPGGQLEFSTRPYPCLVQAQKRLIFIQKELTSQAKDYGIQFIQSGSHPWASSDEIGLQMAKPRYRAMDEYFKKIGPYGARMMRETCTIQVNLDFGNCEEILAKRYFAANLLAPIFTGIFANSPVSLGKANQSHSLRAKIWQNIDPSRTGFPDLTAVSKKWDLVSCADSYLNHVLKANVVFVEAANYGVPATPMTFQQWMDNGYQGIFPTEKDFETHLTLHFPEVRAKGFLELRSIDCQSQAWQIVPACVSTSLLYDDRNLEAVIDLLGSELSNLTKLWEMSEKGLQTVVLHELATKIMYLAIEGFKRLPPCYQGNSTAKKLKTFAETFTFKGRTPADDIIDRMNSDKNKELQAAKLLDLHQTWLD